MLTCVVVVNGKAQVEAQNQTVILDAGEGTYVIPDQPPAAPFCAKMDQVRDWIYAIRGTDNVSDLGSMFVGWPHQPCAASTPGAVAVASHTSTATPVAPAHPATATRPPSPTATATAQPTAVATDTPAVAATATEAATATATATATPMPSPTAVVLLPSSDGMVRIPQGTYTLGIPTPDDYHAATMQVDLPEFWIDQYEVTNLQYKAFMDWTGHAAPAGWSKGTFPAGQDRHPVAGLTWDDAAAYCTWVNKRLPSEAEWEVSGRGPGTAPPLYPWGSDQSAGGKAFDLPERNTYEVGTVAFNKSVFDVYDLIGTVWQWVGDPYGPVPAGDKILRGGRHGLLQDLAYRQPAPPDDERFTRVAGVRCAADRVAGE